MEPTLDPQELEAIRTAMRSGAASTRQAVVDGAVDAEPIALIADDRAAESARPAGMRLANRWVLIAAKALLRVTGIKSEIHVRSTETADGALVREDLAGAWLDALAPSHVNDVAILAAGGPMIEAQTARMLGDLSDRVYPERPPSPTAMRLWNKIGESFATALAEAWRDNQGGDIRQVKDRDRADAWRRSLGPSDLVVVITLGIDGPPAPGWIKLVARPEALVPVVAPLDAVAVSAEDIERALGIVPVDLRVELGRVRLSMAEVRRLRPGDLLTLDRFVDEALPIKCAGVVKAFGRAVVSRGAIGVQVVATEEVQGGQT
ncbi:MAG: flagellar motor switch protein FliM [Myxococcales bacterium]|nr:flagellar motor switch protein FliM [Myxococcales bacterium]